MNNTDTTNTLQQFCTFWLNDRLYGINILNIKEVALNTDITPIFHASEKISGYINIRGDIHLVINMRRLMGFEDKQTDATSRILLIHSDIDESFGILVDKVGSVLDINENQIEGTKSKNRKSVLAELSIGVYKLENDLLRILDAKYFLKLINDKDIRTRK